MKTDVSEIILHVLDIVEYPKDKQAFVQNFYTLVVKETLIVLIKTLPEDDQNNLKVELAQDISSDNVQKVLYAYVGKEKYQKTLRDITQKLFNEFIKTISKDVSDEKKQQIREYLRSFSASN